MRGSRFLFILLAATCFATANFAQPHWRLQTSLDHLSPPLYLAAVNERVVWLSDFNGQTLRTTDGGASWQRRGLVTSEEKISCLAALDENTALAGGAGSNNAQGSASLYRTDNGGASWEKVYSAKGLTPFWYALHMFDRNRGIALSDAPSPNENFLIAKTFDGGATWQRVAHSPRSNNEEFGLANASHFFDLAHGWFGTAVGVHQHLGARVFRTSDGGENWTLLENAGGVELHALRFISPLLGLRATASPPFLTRTSDGGRTWQPIYSLPIAQIQFVKLIASAGAGARTQLWLYGEAGPEYRPFIVTSVDGGATWAEQEIADVGLSKVQHLTATAFGATQDSVQAWGAAYEFATQQTHIISYRAALDRRTEVRANGASWPRTYALAQNYPNPFTRSTTIAFQIARAEAVTLKVFDLTGKEMATLIDEQRAPGQYEVAFTRNDLPAGVYFYRLQAGHFNATRKVVVRD